ncbi:MAG: hypothetical protein U0W24_13390 [Bacteroidales bacterium]
MQQIFDINLIKENPQLFFSNLPKNAEVEIVEFLRFIFYKYNISFDPESVKKSVSHENKDEKVVLKNLMEEFASLRNGLPIDYKFDRHEANER